MKGINRQFKITLLVLVALFSCIFFWNLLRNFIISRSIANNKLIVTVSTQKAKSESWKPSIKAVGTLSAINGVAVSTQEAGNIVSINFNSGQRVKKNDLLIQIDDRAEQGELQSNLATMKLAEITYIRYRELVEKGAISKQNYDESVAKYQEAQGAVARTQAIIAYKHIVAPFDGITGIRNVNLGQYVKQGDNLVFLEAMDPLYANFYLPEKYLNQLHVNQAVILTVDAYPTRTFKGTINALNSLVDTQTHNITVQATIPNKDEKLYPGLFAHVRVLLPAKRNVITIPQTAVNYTLYGDTVYVVVNGEKDKKNQDMLSVSLREVELGDQQDNKVVVKSGLKAGEVVVTSGQLKLSNGQRVKINNTVKP